jgi:Ca2+-binding EF-hand superfamily protein
MSIDASSAIFYMNELGYVHEAEYYQSLLAPALQISNPIVPRCFPVNASLFGPSNELIPVFWQRKRLGLAKMALTESDMGIIARFMDQSEIPISEIDFGSIIRRIGRSKRFLFAPHVLRHFVGPDGTFAADSYLKLVRLLADIQAGMADLLEIDASITDSISIDILGEFIDRYSDRIASLHRLREDLESYREFYVSIVIGRIQFFLPMVGTNRINLERLFMARCFIEYVHMDEMDVSTSPYSVKSTGELYNLFIALDGKRDGLLREDDIRNFHCEFGNFTFSDVFTNRLFIVLGVSNGEMDFTAFLAFIFPLKYIDLEQSAHFFFRVLDFDEDGEISVADITSFYKSLGRVPGARLPTIDSYLAELFDMCQCRGPGITREELVHSGQQHSIIKHLIDASPLLERSQPEPKVDDGV